MHSYSRYSIAKHGAKRSNSYCNFQDFCSWDKYGSQFCAVACELEVNTTNQCVAMDAPEQVWNSLLLQ